MNQGFADSKLVFFLIRVSPVVIQGLGFFCPPDWLLREYWPIENKWIKIRLLVVNMMQSIQKLKYNNVHLKKYFSAVIFSVSFVEIMIERVAVTLVQRYFTIWGCKSNDS